VKDYAVMGGVILEIKLYNNDSNALKVVKAAYLKVKEVDDVCNIYNPESELSRLNNSAFNKPFKCSELLWNVLMKSEQFYKLSNGAFDVSSAPLMSLWGFHRKKKKLPPKKAIDEIKKIIGLDKVVFNHKQKTVQFTLDGMKLDLGGIAKGYAVQLAADELKKFGIIRGIVNLAGNAYCFPEAPPNYKSYKVGIRNPLKKDSVCGVVQMLNQSIATSGNYERFVVIDGKRYAHIMNPVTCKPVEGVYAVTVVTPNATDSDALSTAVFINGSKFAEKVCEEIPGTSILIIKPNKNNKKVEILKFGREKNNFKIKL
jgi:thiamine biosynthesis lipoprotein